MSGRIYLDHASTTPILPEAVRAMSEACAIWANPSSPHAEGRAVRAALEDARRRIGAALGSDATLIFTSGATEAISLVFERAKAGSFVIGAIEHPAVLRSAPDARQVAARADGMLDLEDLDRALASADRPLVAVQSVNNETGVIHPIEAIAAKVKAAGGLLLVDCAQSAGKLPIPDADFVVIAAHKFGGPPGIGALLVRDPGTLDAIGGQEGGFRPGTAAVPSIMGFAAAVEADHGWYEGAKRLRAKLDEGVLSAGGEIVAGAAPRIATIAAYRMPGVPGASQMMQFDLAGIAVSAGSACASGSLKTSHVLTAMGWSEEKAREVIRVSFGPQTCERDIDALLGEWRALFGEASRRVNAPIYLDYQATTPVAPEVAAAMRPWLDDKFANPHSSHRLGREAAAAVEVARGQILGALRSSRAKSRGVCDESVPAPLDYARDERASGRLFFTSGATEAANWALKGAAARLPADRRRIVTLATEHAAVLDTVEWLGDQGFEVDVVPVRKDGLVDIETLAERIGARTGLVAAMLVNNEIGVIQPVAEIGAIAREAGALFFCDAVQGLGRVPVPLGACDMVAVSAHKIHGPKGIGALWLREGVEIDPLLHGGGQEGGIRSGTLSPALCVGFGEAAKLMVEDAESDGDHVEHLWRVSLSLLGDWTINGSTGRRYRGNLSLRRDGVDAARLISDLRGIAFSAGSACASGSGRPSHVLAAIGLSDGEARSSIRLGFGRYTNEEDLRRAVSMIHEAAMRQSVPA